MNAQLQAPKVTELPSTAQIEKSLERAARNDKENIIFSEEFEAQRSVGYLVPAVPKGPGGLNLNFAQFLHQQHSLEWLLHEACNGKVFVTAYAESGNDAPVLDSTTHAERVDGGDCFFSWALDGFGSFCCRAKEAACYRPTFQSRLSPIAITSPQ